MAVRRIQDKREFACARCGGRKLVPLTFEAPRIEYNVIRHTRAPIQARFKCVSCGQAHNLRPSALLAHASIL
jgi:DNA-directed RNA polymerase subunit RPC12/RpoP